MNPGENQEPHQTQPEPPQQNRIFPLKLNPLYLLSILVLVLGISFSIPTTNWYKSHHLKSTLSSQSDFFHNVLRFLHPVGNKNVAKPSAIVPTSPYCVLWMAPFLTGGGYCSEAWSYILALQDYLKRKNPRFRLSIEHHGDLESLEFWEGLPVEMRNLAIELYQTECRLNETIVVCHSEPGAWYPPLFQTLPCPPTGYGRFKVVVGRTMFETDRVNAEHVKRCNKMDYVWVPTEFHNKSFVQSGVDPLKVVKIVQPVDSEFFDSRKYKPLDLASIGKLVLGSRTWKANSEREFVFLSMFKWEYRKGWDVLLRSYLKEFSAADGVALYMLTNPFHSDRDFGNKIVEYVEDSDLEKPVNGWAPVYVVDDHIPQVDLPRLYNAANAFVLPSRGEGWGRPIVEAMAMALPVIATNWSGPTEYLTLENSYPLDVDRMSEVKDGPFKGHLWAEPSVQKLQNLMRHVMTNVDEAKAKGRQARKDMIANFAPEIVAEIVAENVQQIINNVA
ncbi:OLC1v1026426C1 [Oldenlandia corymbosa var. corymbosa]|uniref:OLC1v1026426C1 n=1 Tax=Oldenlandia corymbosa var. corymbosa TaxID=529605 RepID=A0AAV1C7T2_OLDCO|nr:OLC1v1026426C1 [Oldenlandia corymbosa var. corymbosa]